MKKHFFSFVLVFICFSSLKSQQGWWTWMNGNNVSNSAGVYGVQGVVAPANVSPALYHCFQWTDLQGRFWIFGGGDVNNNQHCDLWMYDPGTNMWTWMKGPNTVQTNGVYGAQGVPNIANNPGSRAWGATSWVDNNGDLWLFGGFGFDAVGAQLPLSDLWRYNIATNTWTWMKGPNLANQPGVYGTQKE